ncbi:MAG: 30S ribosomal protein S8 [Holosporales bacterium]|jgi:small subunit ribosomal protein S8|nr:30S ribosomal protein S8 [Holosporales bacterium]
MVISDSIADMLARIRNAQSRRHVTTLVPSSRLRAGVLDVLVREGYIEGYEQLQVDERPHFKIMLKYHEGRGAIIESKRVSRPGCRVYSNIKSLPRVYNGLGISILSTSKGVLSDAEARAENLGGELLCTIF